MNEVDTRQSTASRIINPTKECILEGDYFFARDGAKHVFRSGVFVQVGRTEPSFANATIVALPIDIYREPKFEFKGKLQAVAYIGNGVTRYEIAGPADLGGREVTVKSR